MSTWQELQHIQLVLYCMQVAYLTVMEESAYMSAMQQCRIETCLWILYLSPSRSRP